VILPPLVFPGHSHRYVNQTFCRQVSQPNDGHRLASQILQTLIPGTDPKPHFIFGGF